MKSGISLKTQELYAIVFATRYLDLFHVQHAAIALSFYNMAMKLIFLATSFSIVWYMRYHKVVRRTYDREHDTFKYYILLLPCFLLALLINHKFTIREVSKFCSHMHQNERANEMDSSLSIGHLQNGIA